MYSHSLQRGKTRAIIPPRFYKQLPVPGRNQQKEKERQWMPSSKHTGPLQSTRDANSFPRGAEQHPLCHTVGLAPFLLCYEDSWRKFLQSKGTGQGCSSTWLPAHTAHVVLPSPCCCGGTRHCHHLVPPEHRRHFQGYLNALLIRHAGQEGM